MKPASQFPPVMWADVATCDLKTTTNACESFHRHFGEFFNSRKGNPNIYELLEHLDHNNTLSMVNARSSRNPSKLDRNKKCLENLHAQLMNNDITTNDFLTAVSRKIIVKKRHKLFFFNAKCV